MPAPWDRPPLLVREGSVIPLNLAEQHFANPDDERGFAVFPATAAGTFKDEFFEDDGTSEDYRNGKYGLWEIDVSTDAASLDIALTRAGACPPAASEITLLLPRQETRALRTGEARVLSDRIMPDWREIRLSLV